MLVRIPNSFIEIFKGKSSELQLACAFYSLINQNTQKNLLGYQMTVKQETLAKICGFSILTVKRGVAKLVADGFITSQRRTVREQGVLGTYVYTIKIFDTTKEYFVMDKKLISRVNGQAFRVYATFCKLAERRYRRFYQSLNDLSKILGMSKKEVIKAIKKLISAHLVRKYLKKTEAGDFTDNTYEICVFIARPKVAKRKPLIFRQTRGLKLCTSKKQKTSTDENKFNLNISDFFHFVKRKRLKFTKKFLSYDFLSFGGG